MSSVGITNFEVVQATGPNEGPRSPGAPTADAGPDQTAAPEQPVSLRGYVGYTGMTPVVQWKLYSGPGAVTFGNPALTNCTACFTTPGVYTLMLSAEDGVHAVAYDATVVTVGEAITLTVSRAGANLDLAWSGGAPPYAVESSSGLGSWTPVLTNNGLSATVPISGTNAFFRVRGQ